MRQNTCCQCGKNLNYYKIMLKSPNVCLKHQRELDGLREVIGSDFPIGDYLNGVKPLKILKAMKRDYEKGLKKVEREIKHYERR